MHSRFEGEDAPALIREAIEDPLSSWTAATPDAIAIIRGGGAANDLAWLNDYELAKYVCLSPVPVLTMRPTRSFPVGASSDRDVRRAQRRDRFASS